jgi:mannose-1-phosphate guanylyltransferase
VVTADHFIGELNRFQQCVSYALAIAAETNEFVTFGIPPTRPETGYGYIHIDRANDQACISTPQAFRSVAFKEKPDFDTAVQYVASRNYLWNSGMFFFSITGFRRNLELAQPATAVALRDIVQALESGDHVSAKSCFETIPNLSIDYAVMEKVPYVLTVPATFSWDDVGAWDALERTAEAGEANNAVRGNPILVDVSSSVIVQADPTVHVALLGVQDLIVVSTKHAVMVCHKSQAQRVRELARLVKLLEEESKVDSL